MCASCFWQAGGEVSGDRLFLLLGPPGCGLGGLLEGILVDTCGFCTGWGRVVGQWQVRGTLQITPGLAAAEFPVLLHLYAYAHSGPLGTPLENSCIGCLLVPLVAWSQVLCTFSLSSHTLWTAPQNSHFGAHSSLAWDLALCALHVLPELLHALGCCRQSPGWCPPMLPEARIRDFACTCSPVAPESPGLL